MARKKKHEEHEEHANHERWMLSYADILTLLLALFIVMFAISKVDQQKLQTFAEGTAQAFGQANLAMQGKSGNLDGRDGILENQKPGQETKVPDNEAAQPSPLSQSALQREQAAAQAAAKEKESLKQLQIKIASQLKQAGLANAAKFEINERGLVVNIVTDKVLFDTGKADLRPAGKKVIDTVAPILKGIPNYIAIEGHTDNVPLNTASRSNWELSTDRAAAVLRTLVTDGIPASKVSASGYADQRPIASNKDDAGRAMNRRVAVVILPTVPLNNSAAASNAVQQPPAGTAANTPSNKVGP
ncbi:OmpA/MotB family protein [Dermatophilus congolensis]|uniref:OmpA/MotB family protein n=1 Tax=Dermatophilus congolensis TaxID=1863 RepID=UPI001AAEC753|nr:flagellar motor protein MotB [Dermatophilus congolensis]MBO3143387.1 flagellar motor protein MotB [Dermatophilus congolensis]MBO3152377.1 flagellar motor protein MotB [Dermatophilus congolensis]MBO3160612.1 flagellar motor protein MotB [Dermatophilus congolensis]MBO3163665.1 flagellar motor protein MotB [Dermatophilus congolensis]MBO3177211.1 flagellar motor protein MotB [Dermatophilus congolensis]